MMRLKLNIAVPFHIFIARISFKYCQKGIEKQIFIIETNSQNFKTRDNSQGNEKMSFALKRLMAFKISENDLKYFLKSTTFYLSKSTD